MRNLPFDDIDAINAAASEEYCAFGPPMEVTQAMIDTFADVTGDHQWIHVDQERAAAGPFGRTIAHGFLSLSLLPKLIAGQLPVTGYRNIVNYGADSLRFILPVPSGSMVHARTRIIGAAAKDSGTLVTSAAALHVVGVDKPSVLYQMLSLFQG